MEGASGTAAGESLFGMAPDGVLRVCYDLNVFYSAFLNDRRGKQNTTAQRLVDALQLGACPIGTVQLVVSKSMTTHLAKNLEAKLGVPAAVATAYADALEVIARHGPQSIPPIVFSGPTGFTGVLDPDVEDSRVLETAIAARAHLLVTADSHFVGPRPMPARSLPIPESPGAVEYTDGENRLLIARPERFVHWWGEPIEAATAQADTTSPRIAHSPVVRATAGAPPYLKRVIVVNALLYPLARRPFVLSPLACEL